MKENPTEAHCDYCSRPGSIFTKFLSGEPVVLCGSQACQEEHNQALDEERADMKASGLLPTA